MLILRMPAMELIDITHYWCVNNAGLFLPSQCSLSAQFLYMAAAHGIWYIGRANIYEILADSHTRRHARAIYSSSSI